MTENSYSLHFMQSSVLLNNKNVPIKDFLKEEDIN